MTDIPYNPSAAQQNFGRAAVVTKHDDNPNVFSSLWVGGLGNVAVIPAGQTDAVTFTAVAAGTLLPIAVNKVLATGTTATLIVGLR